MTPELNGCESGNQWKRPQGTSLRPFFAVLRQRQLLSLVDWLVFLLEFLFWLEFWFLLLF